MIDLVRLAEYERRNWHVDRAKTVTRFTRIGGPTCLDKGPILPDWALEAPVRVRLNETGEKGAAGDRDDSGRMWIDFHAINPDEIVDHWLAGRIRFSWDSLEESLEEFMAHPKILHAHDPGQPVGMSRRPVLTPAETVARGFISSAPGLPEYWQGMARDGAADGSIGVDFQEADWLEKERVLQVNKAALIEWSLVGIPAMKSSFIRSVPLWAEGAKQPAEPAEETPEKPEKLSAPKVVPLDTDPGGLAALTVASLARVRAAGGGMGGGR